MGTWDDTVNTTGEGQRDGGEHKDEDEEVVEKEVEEEDVPGAGA